VKKTFYKVNSFRDLTKEQIWDMLRKPRNSCSPTDFIKHYKIKELDYCDFLKEKGLRLTREDRKIHQKHYVTKPNKGATSTKIKSIELVAMRAFRGFSRVEFAKKVFLSLNRVTEMENRYHKVIKAEADLYIDNLKIHKRHIFQLREILSGRSDRVEDERTIPTIIKIKVWSRDKCKCTKCESEQKLHIHHIIHFAKGGQHKLNNLVLLCAKCHAEQHKGERVYSMLKSIAEG